MTYICVKCSHTWILGEPTDHFSGGICRECITLYIRSKQAKAGTAACFGKPELCSEEMSCRFRECCIT